MCKSLSHWICLLQLYGGGSAVVKTYFASFNVISLSIRRKKILSSCFNGNRVDDIVRAIALKVN